MTDLFFLVPVLALAIVLITMYFITTIPHTATAGVTFTIDREDAVDQAERLLLAEIKRRPVTYSDAIRFLQEQPSGIGGMMTSNQAETLLKVLARTERLRFDGKHFDVL